MAAAIILSYAMLALIWLVFFGGFWSEPLNNEADREYYARLALMFFVWPLPALWIVAHGLRKIAGPMTRDAFAFTAHKLKKEREVRLSDESLEQIADAVSPYLTLEEENGA